MTIIKKNKKPHTTVLIGNYLWLVLANPKTVIRKSSQFRSVPEIQGTQLPWIKPGVSFQGCASPRCYKMFILLLEKIYIYIFWYCRNSWNMNLFSSSSIYNFNILPKGTSAVGCCKWWTKTELAGFSINKCSFFELKTCFQQNLLSFGTEVTCVLVLGPGEIINYMM